MQENECPVKFPFFLLTDPDNVELDKTTGLSRLKHGGLLETLVKEGKTYPFLFTSEDRAQAYVRFNKGGPRAGVPIENAHDFICQFDGCLEAGVDEAILDFAEGQTVSTTVSLRELLDTMRRIVGDQLRELSTRPGTPPGPGVR